MTPVSFKTMFSKLGQFWPTTAITESTRTTSMTTSTTTKATTSTRALKWQHFSGHNYICQAGSFQHSSEWFANVNALKGFLLSFISILRGENESTTNNSIFLGQVQFEKSCSVISSQFVQTYFSSS